MTIDNHLVDMINKQKAVQRNIKQTTKESQLLKLSFLGIILTYHFQIMLVGIDLFSLSLV